MHGTPRRNMRKQEETRQFGEGKEKRQARTYYMKKNVLDRVQPNAQWAQNAIMW